MSDKILPSVCETVDPLLLAQSNADYWSDKYDKKYEECEALKKEHQAILKARDEKLREAIKAINEVQNAISPLSHRDEVLLKVWNINARVLSDNPKLQSEYLDSLLASSNDERAFGCCGGNDDTPKEHTMDCDEFNPDGSKK